MRCFPVLKIKFGPICKSKTMHIDSFRMVGRAWLSHTTSFSGVVSELTLESMCSMVTLPHASCIIRHMFLFAMSYKEYWHPQIGASGVNPEHRKSCHKGARYVDLDSARVRKEQFYTYVPRPRPTPMWRSMFLASRFWTGAIMVVDVCVWLMMKGLIDGQMHYLKKRQKQELWLVSCDF